MAKVAEKGIVWFDKDIIWARMLRRFGEFHPKTMCIMDCTEIFIEQPGSQKMTVQPYSNYKHPFTS